MVLRRDEDGDVVACIKEFEGCVADGADEAEALSNLKEVMAMWISARIESSLPIPHPEGEQELPSGKWLQRVPRSLHRDLVALAEREETSLNQLVTSILSAEVGRRESRSAGIIRGVEAVAHASINRWGSPAAHLFQWHLLDTARGTRERIEGVFVRQLVDAIPSNPTKLPERQEVKGAVDDKDRKIWAN
jgi:antitoxin HicB